MASCKSLFQITFAVIPAPGYEIRGQALAGIQESILSARLGEAGRQAGIQVEMIKALTKSYKTSILTLFSI
jgi:hypothetical protein